MKWSEMMRTIVVELSAFKKCGIVNDAGTK